MKSKFEKRSVLAASITVIGLAAPTAAWADEADDEIRRLTRPESEVELGIGSVTSGSAKFGDYTGLNERGVYGIANISVIRRGEDDAGYLEIVGRNLGLDSRSFNIDGGKQGDYSLRLGYDELPKLFSDTYRVPYLGAGSTRLTQPAGLTDGANPAAMVGLAASMQPFQARTDRKSLSLGMTKLLPDGWDVALNFKRENKEGTKLTAGPIQIGTGGARGTVVLPEPVDYVTDQVDAIARYAGEKLQLQVGYYGSIFKNANQSLTWDNLFTGDGNTTARFGLPASNQFHQINAAGGYTLSKETRLSGSVSFGRMTQNEAFLPYSTGGFMPATSSLNGRVDATHADIKLLSKLTHAISLTAGYRYDDRDNRTPVNQYDYRTADRDAGGTGTATNALRRWNTPLSKTKQVAYADLDFHLSAATKLKLGYDYDHVKHTYEATAGDKEQTLKAEVKHRFNDMASGGIAYAHSDRDASDYNGAAPLMATYSSGYLASLCVSPNTFSYNGVVTACTGAASANGATTPWLDTPALRKSFLADRKRDKLRAFANVAPHEKLDLQFGVSYYNDKYSDTEAGFGLTSAKGTAVNFDAYLKATDAVTGTFFASLENFSIDQNAHNGSTTNRDRELNNAAFDVRTGVVTNTDRSLTLGLGFRVKPGGKYEWGGDFTHANTVGVTRFSDLGTAIAATVLPLPDTHSRLNRLDLFGKYEVQKDVSVNVKYAYERYSSADWAYDGQTLTSSTSLIGSGETSPNYKVHMIGASVSYRFR